MMDENYKRTYVYSNTNNQKPKEMFIWLVGKLKETGIELKSILDVGAAAGGFLRFAHESFPNAELVGVEYDDELVLLGNVDNPPFTLKRGDAYKLDEQSFHYDAVLMTGTHSIFDDFRPAFSETIRATKDGGYVLITGLFNDYPIDARIKWRYSDDAGGWQSGYNLFSKESVARYLNAQPRVADFSFEKFIINLDIDPRDDPIRSWTRMNSNGTRELINGIMPLNIELLMIRVGNQWAKKKQ